MRAGDAVGSSVRGIVRLVVRAWPCLLLPAVSCSWLVKPVEARLAGLAWNPEQGLELAVVATNPNRFAVRLSELEYRLAVEGTAVGRGRYPGELELRPGVATLVRLPFTPDAAGILRSLPRLAGDDAACRVEGEYRLRTPLGRVRLGFRVEERLAVRERLREAVSGSDE
ncbi:MAG: LEA type 2 family protein [bacterium]